MDWFFGFSGNSAAWFQDMIKVAVISAKENTSLVPHCLYDGNDSDLLVWLNDNGVNVIRTSVPFRDELFSEKIILANKGSQYLPNNATGHFLRILVSSYANSDIVLYTDCDVMFLGDFEVSHVNCLGVVNEFYLNNGRVNDGFNSGVMLFNKSHLADNLDSLIEHFRENNFYSMRYSSYDQALLNEFYSSMPIDYIDPIYNWRPFQGVEPSAKIVHFHGPKPHRLDDIMIGKLVPGEEGLLPYIEKNKDSYVYYLSVFKDFLHRA
jgi:lipopolysaccharide biosynthesis glycosyltransferase